MNKIVFDDDKVKKALLNAARKRVFSTEVLGAELHSDPQEINSTLKKLAELDLVSPSKWASPGSGIYQVTDKGFQIADGLR